MQSLNRRHIVLDVCLPVHVCVVVYVLERLIIGCNLCVHVYTCAARVSLPGRKDVCVCINFYSFTCTLH